ncbi:GNAT family N-acetyltransferase [Dyella subtropica]|uniref:GNAT family N-acetyltransferase n=1 Tax=Dyella subtropica TaxID=2992127 RepID=UPI0022584E17|nr:GNAT family N-acetyltransferase [Dyella subtropica]
MQAQAGCSASEASTQALSLRQREGPIEASNDRLANVSESTGYIAEPFASIAISIRTPACHADRYASPGLADAWAQAIITSWQAAYRAGQLDPAQPLYLLDLAPGNGHLARLLWRALQQHLPSFPCWGEQATRPWTIRYLACAAPGFGEPKLVDEYFDTLPWSPLDDHDPPPSSRHAHLWHQSSNPLIVLALNYLQAFPGQLRAVHDGNWLEGRVLITAEHDDRCELDVDWQAIDDDASCPASLRQRYLRTLSNSCVLIPDAGLYALRRIAELTHGRFLWLAADQAVINEQQLRFGAMSPPSTWLYEAPCIPVNFHALAYDQAGQGAWCWHGQQHTDGMAVQAIWRHDGMPTAHGECSRLAEYLCRYQPDDTCRLETLASSLAPESLASMHLALLRGAHFDPRVLRSSLAAWMENPPELTDVERSDWGDAIARGWQVCPGSDDETDLRHSLAVFAVQLGRLDIARAIFEHDGNRACMALCYSLGGRVDLALLCADGVDDPSVDSLRSDLKQRLARWQALGWYHAEGSHDGELCLVPLDEDHAQELYEQYRDPQIGELTRLPELDTPEMAREWIAEQSHQTGRATYALMHIDMGLIGVVSVQTHGEDAYFYFWIGSAHQNKGLGRRAGRLLCLQAERLGLQRLFTSAYQTNHRSIDALHALGFRSLPLQAMTPDDDLLFFVRDEAALPTPWDIWRERLKALLVANKSPIELAISPHEVCGSMSSGDNITIGLSKRRAVP